MASGTGKIKQLPHAIREELNRRLLDGQTGPKILPWLNSLPEVKALLAEDFEGLAVNDQNLTDWRKRGYQEWLAQRRNVEQVRDMAAFSMKVTEAGGRNLSDSAASIISGQILGILEQLPGMLRVQDDESPEETLKKVAAMKEAVEDLTLAVSRLRKGDHNAVALQLARERLKQTGETIALNTKKFQRETLELFIKWSKDQQAQRIVSGDESNDAKTEKLGQLIFKEDWK